MSILHPTLALVNPRDMWGVWTDADRWVPTDDDYRPSADFGFAPTIADDDEAADLLNDDAGDHDDLEWDAFQAKRMESAFADPFDLLSPNELIEARGFHPAMPRDNA
jgi:hypothetical protein